MLSQLPGQPVYVGIRDLVFSAMPSKLLTNNQMYANPQSAKLIGNTSKVVELDKVGVVVANQPANLDMIAVQCSFFKAVAPSDVQEATIQIRRWLGTHSYNMVVNVGQRFDVQLARCKVVSTRLVKHKTDRTNQSGSDADQPGCFVMQTHVVVQY